jgi:hypothetical protein
MKRIQKAILAIAVVGIVCFVLLTSPGSSAQKLPKSIYIQAQAFGESTQMGRTFGITVIVEEYSTEADKQALLQAFAAKGNEGLVNALYKMKAKGRIAITGTLGYDVSYIRKFPQPDGTYKIRLVTNRVITFGEAWSDSRSTDYNLSGMEVVINPADKGKNSGVLYPACQFKMSKEKELTIELYQNPWRLAGIMVRK